MQRDWVVNGFKHMTPIEMRQIPTFLLEISSGELAFKGICSGITSNEINPMTLSIIQMGD